MELQDCACLVSQSEDGAYMRLHVERLRPIRLVRPWPGVLIDLTGRHPRVRHDEIWRAGRELARRVRR